MILEYLAKCDQFGNPKGPTIGRIRSDLQKHFAGSFVKIQVTGFVNPPSRRDRAFYFGTILKQIAYLLNDAGYRYDANDRADLMRLHRDFVEAFVPPEITKDNNGRIMTLPPTTKGMSTSQFSRFVDDVVMWAAEQGIELKFEYDV